MYLASVLSTVTPEDVLISLSQDGCHLEDYVEEFLKISHLVSWLDDYLFVSRRDHLHPGTVYGLCTVVEWLLSLSKRS